MKTNRVQSLMVPGVSPRNWRPQRSMAPGTLTLLLTGSLFLSALQMAAPGGVTAAPYQTEPTPYYFSKANYANSPLYKSTDTTNYPGIRKFVDTLPGLGAASVNNLGQYIPVAVSDPTAYLGSDYYEIAAVEYTEKMHKDLPATKLRGYVQLSTSKVPGKRVALLNPDGSKVLLPNGTQAYGVDKAHYLGPLISATKDKPVRILFRNLLPKGVKGNLFIPTDTTVMGSGPGPAITTADPDPQNPMCGGVTKPVGCYTENRATVHLHGGLSPWISDGTPHQWITPAGENTLYLKGESVKNVPDMPDPGPGAMTLFYTNQQSARLMFYHDHAWGITRLNVYAGGAAPYVITDDAEKKLIADGVLPVDVLPLVIQDKTFVASDKQMTDTDPLWDKSRWGAFGQLWLPHVFVPAQNTGDASGVNQFGRWAYGPWFWPPTNNIDYPPINNPYYKSTCNPDTPPYWCEPQLIPATPFNSMGMEAFHDTPVVNGTAYPTVTLAPKPYRLRILNAANDRFFNLSLYKAVDANKKPCDAANTNPAPEATGVTCTEVALNPAEVAAALTDPTFFPTPLAGREGPSWIQIATEGGFLPTPAVIPPQFITWVTDFTVFNAGNVDKHGLLIGPAERADVVVDFSAYAGQTLILYNDAPAAFPARDPRYDYYTGNGDFTLTGGAPPTVAGYGPNIRTVMRIKVEGTPGQAFNQAALDTAFAHNTNKTGVFESAQLPIIVGQGPYNAAYGTNFTGSEGLVQIYDEALAFNTLAGVPLSMPLQRKAIQDEMGEAFDPMYGRMSGSIGLESPNATAGTQQNLVLYPFVNPATEILNGIALPPGVQVTPITSADDGTQIWKITHNGVDTHPIHFHLFDVQLLNRVGWDGIVRKPDANELGWKDTVRISPLEDTTVAMRPFLPKLPFGLPDSIRHLNPAMPDGSTAIFNNTDGFGNAITPPITNVLTNFEWEYVWHCHILSHEEMDMMRPMSVQVNPVLPYPPAVTYASNASGRILSWVDPTPIQYVGITTWGDMANEIGYRIERAAVANNGNVSAYAQVGTALANATSFTDKPPKTNGDYRYRVVPYNAAGETKSAPVGGPAVAAPAAPTNIQAVFQAGPKVSLTWQDNATNESFFLVELSVDGGPFTLIAQIPARSTTGNVTYVDTLVSSSHAYLYQVSAVNAGGSSAWVKSNPIASAASPAAPSNLTGTVVRTGNRAEVTLNWVDNATNENGFTLERATNAAFTVGLTPTTVAANATTVTQSKLYRGVPYYFRIKADNTGGSSVWSNVLNINTP